MGYKYSKQSNMKTAQEKKEALRDRILTLSQDYKTNPDHLLELVRFSSNFYNYSLNNTMLIHAQNPGSTFVQSYMAWKSMGYPVKAKEKGITISVPVKTTYLKIEDQYVKLSQATSKQAEAYKNGKIEGFQKLSFFPGTVFDISQTTYPPEKYPQLFTMGYPSQTHDQVIAGLTDFSSEYLQVPVAIRDLKSISLRGYYDTSNKTIALNDRLNSTERLSTLSHELGHALMRHEKGMGKSSSQIEWEGDAMSIMIQSSLGLDIPDTRKQHLKDHYSRMALSLNNFDDIKIDQIFGNVFAKYKEYKPLMDECIEKYISKEQLQEIAQHQARTPASDQLFKKYYDHGVSILPDRDR